MKKKALCLVAIIGLFSFLLLSYSASALSCSFVYSSRGSCIFLTPTLSSDTAYYRWTIESANGTSSSGTTQWIPRNESFIHTFTLDYASNYQINLVAKNAVGSTTTFSRSIYTTTSSLTVQEGDVTIVEEEGKPERTNLVDYFLSYFNKGTLIEKIFVVVGIVLLIWIAIAVIFAIPKNKLSRKKD